MMCDTLSLQLNSSAKYFSFAFFTLHSSTWETIPCFHILPLFLSFLFANDEHSEQYVFSENRNSLGLNLKTEGLEWKVDRSSLF